VVNTFAQEIVLNLGKSWLLGPGKVRVGHDRVFGFGTNARTIASGGKRGYIGSQPKGKTETQFQVCVSGG
jgi:hypothetical protein